MLRLSLLVCLVLSAAAFVARDVNQEETNGFPDGIEISRGDVVIGPLPDFSDQSFAGRLHSKFGENVIGPLPETAEISNLISVRMSMIGPIPE